MNLLIFHVHDMGRYCSPNGYALPTPNMRAFAERGTLFRNAHAAAPTCSPSRAALLTGQTAHQAGMLGLRHRGFDLADYSRHLGNFLKQNGYETALAGIQHEFDPQSEQELPYARFLQPSTKEGSVDEQTARAAAEYLDGVGDRPFFLWTGLFYPHRPFLKADPDKRNPHFVQPPAPLPDTPETRQDMADYMTTVAHADACFREVMAALDRNGLQEKTVVILTTDHGIAFPEMKCNLTHHGTGVTFVIDYPGNPMKGEVSDALVSHMDVFPTLCELLELEKPPWLIGQSLLPLLKGETEAIRDDHFSEVTYHAGREFMRGVRTNRYNLIRLFDPMPTLAMVNIDGGYSKSLLMKYGLSNETPRERLRLYDLVFDPQERDNVADDPAYADVLADMQQRLDHWMRSTDDPLLHGFVDAPEGARVDPRDQLDPG